MSLHTRLKRFAEFKSRFTVVGDYPMIAVHKIDEELFKRLQHAICVYMSKCLPDQKLFTDEQSVLREFGRLRSLDRGCIKNCTPNGMLVPKNYTILEYNAVVQAYAAIIESLNANDFIDSWHVPLNVRYKDGEVVQENMTRHHPTEHIHSDAWAGESPASVTTILPILGDAENNYVQFYAPPSDFEEDWLKPRPTYQDGADIAAKYTRIDVPFMKGHIYLADFATLHSSSRRPDSQARVSIDTTFALARSNEELAAAEKRMHEWRKEERATQRDLFEVGKTKLFVFPDSADHQVDSRGGFKHPTTLKLIEILPTNVPAATAAA